MLDNTKWLQKRTLDMAKQRLMDLLPFLLYPDEILDDGKLEEYYKELVITPEDSFKNLVRLQKFCYQKFCENVGKSFLKTHWAHPVSLLHANAYYNPMINAIDLPVSQARGIYYNANRPAVLNFGTLGSIIGHEITHAFNQIGLNEYPTTGGKSHWWTEDDTAAFNDRAKCIVEQYENFRLELPGNVYLQINGNLTLDENLSDNVGIKLSYRAYQKWIKDSGMTESRLPGLNFNMNQLFWIAYGNAWCETYPFPRSAEVMSQLAHSFVKFRVTGSMSNAENFSTDFNCPPDSPMNPKKKCSVW